MKGFQQVMFYGKTHKRIFKDDGSNYIQPCKSSRCSSPYCRKAYVSMLDGAIRGVALNYRFSTLLTINRSSIDETHRAAQFSIEHRDELFGDNARIVTVTEPHKAGIKNTDSKTGYHLHALILHNTKRRMRKRIKAGSKTAQFQTLDLSDPTQAKKFNPAYLFKEILTHEQNHRARNKGRLYVSSPHFFLTPDTAGARDKRTGAYLFYKYFRDVRENTIDVLARAYKNYDRAERLFYRRLRFYRGVDLLRLTSVHVRHARKPKTPSATGKRRYMKAMTKLSDTVLFHYNLLYLNKNYLQGQKLKILYGNVLLI